MKGTYSQYMQPEDVSLHRQTLMGIAIFSVMLSHWFGFQGISAGFPYRISVMFARLVFTAGLLFLSGFGLYYSFSSNQNIIAFYKRRLIRLYLPFFLLSVPLYTFFLVARDGYGFGEYIGQLTTVFFWVGGNYGGMWYVSLSLLLYFLFPFIYKFLFGRSSVISPFVRFIAVLILVYLFLLCIKTACGEYYDRVEIGLEKIPFFIIGLFFAYEVKDERISHKKYLWLFLIVSVLYLLLTFTNHCYHNYWIKQSAGVFQKLFFMPLLCCLFNLLKGGKAGRAIIRFFDWFGKYSLELYILHLHFYMLFRFCCLHTYLPPVAEASLPMFLAILLCAPVNKMMGKISGYLVSNNKLHE